MRHIDFSISLRTKLILMVAGTLVLSIIVIGYLIRGIVYQNIVNNKMKTVDILTASLVHDIKYDYDVQRRENVEEIIAKFMTYYRIIRDISFYNRDFLNIADSDPKLVGQTAKDPAIIAAISLAKPSVHITNSDWKNLGIRSIAPILQGSRIVGAIVMDISIEDIQVTLSAIDRRIATILIIAVLLASIVLFIMLRGSILLRLSRLITVTQQIASGNYDIQVRDDWKDEIGELAQAFNRMTTDLRKSKEELEDYNKHLEERVQDATSQLLNAYENLKNAQSQLVLNEKMASLGVLTTGIAHEINTPVGAILNVSRNLENKIKSLPKVLEAFKKEPDIPVTQMVACLEDLLQASCNPYQATSYKETRMIENLLREHGIRNFKEMANSLTRLNFTDQEKILKYIDCFRLPSFFFLVESFGSIVQAAKISEASSRKIAEIVRALKFYAYTDKDRVELTQVNESIQTALVLLRNRFKHTVNVSTKLDPDLPKIPCTSEINQVWTNLVSNACDAVEAMGNDYPGEILISTQKGGDQIMVTVTDNGIGIPEEKIEKIFDPFFTTKDIGKGTGLGLSIVSGILNKHDGTIHVRSHRGRTVFEIALPVGSTLRGSTVDQTEKHTDDQLKIAHESDTLASILSGNSHGL